MRMLLAILLATGGLVAVPDTAQAEPADCPPNCNSIPASAWMAPGSIPLYPAYQWPDLSGSAVAVQAPRWKFEEACAIPPVPGDPREYAVAARAALPQPDREWQLQSQVVHWRGETWRTGATAQAMLHGAANALRACQRMAPDVSPSVTTDEPDRLAAVISVGGQWVLRQYLAVQPRSGSMVELAMWATTPAHTEWAPVPDAVVFDALTAPLCTAYIGSCR